MTLLIDIYVRNLQSTDKMMIPATNEVMRMRKITWRMTEMLLTILKAFSLCTHYILCVAAEQSVAPSFSPLL